jgi:hypothetical protein
LNFIQTIFFIKDQPTKRTLLQGKCEGGLYPLVPQNSRFNSSRQAFRVNKPSIARWHSRLGHPAFPIVKQVLRNNNLPVSSLSHESVCDPCQQAKSHQLPCSRSSSISTFPLELIHSDVWGPAPTSVGRHTYYVSFVDGFSKHTWIYFLKKKSDVFQVFHNFQNFVERKFSRKILTIQTKLNSFSQKIGIAHHVSCPYAHQQNGVVERKHRHLVQVGLALLANASMPLKFWDEAFLTTAHLINITSTKVLDYQTPTEVLLKSKPDYSSLRVFGCACWPNLRPFNSRKLTFRSKR